MSGLSFQVLGPLTILRDGEPIALTGRRQRLLLALLLADAGHTIPAARLVDALWGDEPPDDPMNTVQQYVGQLRKALEPGRRDRARDGIIATQPPGYRLDLRDHDLDANDADRLIRRAQTCLVAGHPPEAVALAEQALGLWHGAPFEEFPDEPFLYAAITRLDERRLDLLEIVTTGEHALGNHQHIVDLLAHEHDEWPRRERLAIHYVSALAGVGRHPDAVDAARTYRATLAARGLEPSPELAELEVQVLNHRGLPDDRKAVGDSASRVAPLLRRLLDQTPVADSDIDSAASPESFAEWHLLAVAAAANIDDLAADADGWLRTHERHRAGYTVALEWAHRERPALAAALALELARWWDWQGEHDAIRTHLTRALERLGPDEVALRGDATSWLAFSVAPTDPAAGARLLEHALAIDADPVRHAHTRCIESVIVRTSDAQRSYLASRHAIEVFMRNDLPTELSYAHVTAALAAIELGDEAAAHRHADHATDLYQALGDQRGQAWAGVLAHQLGRSDDPTPAAEFARTHNDHATATWLDDSKS
jgi:DNA-binding SARP family transcriptional activator